MKKLYQENYFSRRNWIMENLASLDLSAIQAVTVLMIDYKNEFRLPVSIETLAQSTGYREGEIDRTIAELCQKGYLSIKSTARKIVFDLSGLFEDKPSNPDKDIFETFETEFRRPLSQKDMTMLAGWTKKYDEVTVLKGLREAVKYGKLSFEYIDRILVSRESNEEKQ